MNKKTAILRGINVGGKRRILMADLKRILQDLGLKNVLTYIQSGNVIFTSNDENRDLEEKIERVIKNEFGHEVPVIVRSSEELEQSISQNPFYYADKPFDTLHLTFLKERPSKENVEQLETYRVEPDKFVLHGQDVFIYCEGKYHQSKLTNNFFEKKLKVGATTRNWKTVLKLHDLLRNQALTEK